MGSENLDLVRSIFSAWERGDFSSTDWADPDIEFEITDGPAPGRWSGLAGLTHGFRDFVSAWEGYSVQADEYRELDDNRVLALLHPEGRGRTSGLDLGQTKTRAANLFHIRDGKVIRLLLYLEGDRALAELGLEPDDSGAVQ